MNRFRTKKKGKDEDGAPRPSQDSESSLPFLGFRKGKKAQVEEKKEIDLATALPSNDDFRTSLLMTGLSARFSMLREQDDPNTKIGKASDDSVLFPKRQSRLDMAAFRGLGDIAEVESIKAASPFARMGSYHSDDADSLKSGGIMSRAKPTEGNNLFGGRQKIYKIPANATSSKTADGGMGGRALYDDDVALSAFQKWRRAERERDLSQDESDGPDGPDGTYDKDERHPSIDVDPRSASPAPSGYSRKRETSSTLSSIPYMARNSSAATSITSTQPTPSLKDWQPPSSSSAGLERSVTRTRRLYETGFLTHDAQESGPTGLSRMDTLNRQRPFGARTPELGPQSPSAIAPNGFAGRLSGEKKLLAMGSAPNLRSSSPTAQAPTRTPDLGIRVPSAGESKSSLGSAPPLSPSISETDENAILPINPNDHGKATALGVFQKPAKPYDESRYAERQLQLQRGRETPATQRKGSDETSGLLAQSRSSEVQGMADSPTAPAFEASLSLARDQVTSFLADPDESDASSLASSRPMPSPQVHLRRPSDREHPALRDSAVPSPLSVVTKSQDGNSLTVGPMGASPADSPTLGPGTDVSGLSGMVRQHLRGDSNASSTYEAAPLTTGLESRFPAPTANATALHGYGAGSSPWGREDHGRDWNLDLDVNEPLGDGDSLACDPAGRIGDDTDGQTNRRASANEFAHQLADGARRVRERLTSFVETDSRSSSPHRATESRDGADSGLLLKPTGLGSILRPKSSRGSLVDRGRDPSASRARKMMGMTAGGSRAASPANDPVTRKSGVDSDLKQERTQDQDPQVEAEHPGLRAFRQARRDLQKLNGLETEPRQFPAPQGPPPDIPPHARSTREPGNSRTPSRDQQSSHFYAQHRIPSDELRSENSSTSPHMSPRIDRERGESNSSNGALSTSRPGRSNEGSGTPTPHLALRSPGLSGTDIKRSHIGPPQFHPNPSARMNRSNFTANNQLSVPRGYDTDQPSSPSSGASPFVRSAPPTPSSLSPPRPLIGPSSSYDNSTAPMPGGHEAMRRKVRPRDISDPRLAVSTSRDHPTALPAEAQGNRSRSNSRSAPPVPPINPRRRQDSNKARTMLDSFSHHKRDGNGREKDTMDDSGGRVQDGSGTDLVRPHWARGDGTTMSMNFDHPRTNSPSLNIGPPASRMVVTQGRSRPGTTTLPGGMI
ncbi:hypothetical protein F5Y17DRAFT_208217 [Xylariaceae sp. FL0594]|nr:hypothetical protein F5Y17DRAFT_208217 [Xylariaceae sp. FL0594]